MTFLGDPFPFPFPELHKISAQLHMIKAQERHKKSPKKKNSSCQMRLLWGTPHMLLISSIHLWVLLYKIIFTTYFILQGPNDTEPITLQDDYFNRYDNLFSNTPWGSNSFNFVAGNKSLYLDIENISITQNILIAFYLNYCKYLRSLFLLLSLLLRGGGHIVPPPAVFRILS